MHLIAKIGSFFRRRTIAIGAISAIVFGYAYSFELLEMDFFTAIILLNVTIAAFLGLAIFVRCQHCGSIIAFSIIEKIKKNKDLGLSGEYSLFDLRCPDCCDSRECESHESREI